MSIQQVQEQREQIIAAKRKGWTATLRTYLKLSGPGWLQSAVTLGGGTLASSLYLGIIGGYAMLWLQPLMMFFGVVMLSAIAHTSLSSEETPFRALNTHVSPVLGWGWIIATMMANLVWAMPQFSLGIAALRQNLGIFAFPQGEYVAAAVLLVASAVVVWLYDRGGLGYKLFDACLKLMVAVVVVSFFLVVWTISRSAEGLPWESILQGFVPNPWLIFEPAPSLKTLVEASSAPQYWHDTIVSSQRDVMVAAAATAVGINMTFLLPYSMRTRGWDREFRGLVKFDLATGLFIPFVLATSCVVIAAAQFHARPEPGLIDSQPSDDSSESASTDQLRRAYEQNLWQMLTQTKQDVAISKLPEADRILAATLVERDAFALANALERWAGGRRSQVVFGIGVVGMVVSSIIILMLINGFALCEMMDHAPRGWLYRLGCLLPGVTGALGALFLWSGRANFYLAVPTSRFGMVLLPIAYVAFFGLMNNRRFLGGAMPTGASRVTWNVLMGVAMALSVTGAVISIGNDTNVIPGTNVTIRTAAIGILTALLVASAAVYARGRRS